MKIFQDFIENGKFLNDSRTFKFKIKLWNLNFGGNYPGRDLISLTTPGPARTSTSMNYGGARLHRMRNRNLRLYILKKKEVIFSETAFNVTHKSGRSLEEIVLCIYSCYETRPCESFTRTFLSLSLIRSHRLFIVTTSHLFSESYFRTFFRKCWAAENVRVRD